MSNTDLVIAMRHVQGGFLRVLTEGKTPDGGGSHGWREDGEPDARASQDIDYDPRGVEITLRGRGFRRHGRLSWAQIASWIDAGVTPARLGIILTAGRLRSACAARGGLAVTGTGDFDAVMAELDRIREDGVNAVIDAALQAHGAEAPVPPARRGGPAFYTTAIAAGPDRVRQRRGERGPGTAGPAAAPGLQPAAAHPAGSADHDPAVDRRRAARLRQGPRRPRRDARLGRHPGTRPGAALGRDDLLDPARPGGRWYDGQPEGLRTATDVELRARMWNLVPWEEIPAWVQPGLTGSLRSRLLAAVPGKGNNEPGSLRDALDAAWAAIEAAPPPSPAELDDARHVYGGASPAQQALFGDPPPDGKNTPRPAKASPARQDETPGTAAGSAQGQPDALGQTAGSPGTQPNRAGQAPQGAGANDAQAPPAAASQEPPPDGHGDSQAGNDGTAPAESTSSARARKRPRASRHPQTAPHRAAKPARTRPQPRTRKRPVRQRRPARPRPRRSRTSPRTRPSRTTTAPRRQRPAQRVTAVTRTRPGTPPRERGRRRTIPAVTRTHPRPAFLRRTRRPNPARLNCPARLGPSRRPCPTGRSCPTDREPGRRWHRPLHRRRAPAARPRSPAMTSSSVSAAFPPSCSASCSTRPTTASPWGGPATCSGRTQGNERPANPTPEPAKP